MLDFTAILPACIYLIAFLSLNEFQGGVPCDLKRLLIQNLDQNCMCLASATFRSCLGQNYSNFGRIN